MVMDFLPGRRWAARLFCGQHRPWALALSTLRPSFRAPRSGEPGIQVPSGIAPSGCAAGFRAAFARPGMTDLVIVPRHVLLRHALIFHRRLEHHAVGELVDHAALDLLPRRLAARDTCSRRRFSSAARRFASSAFEIRMSAVPLLRSMRTRSPVLSSASPPPAAASGEALRIDGEPEVPDCRPSPMQGSEVMPRLISARRRLHVHHLGRARIADRRRRRA